MKAMPATRTVEWTHFCATCGARTSAPGACDRDGAPLRPIPARGVIGRQAGNYLLVELLGEGGMGAVYRAVQPAIGANVAIKLLHAHSDPGVLQRALVEAQAVNRIRDAGVVKILDVGEFDDQRPYLVMEWLDGISLADAMRTRTVSVGTACAIVADVLDTLALAHDESIVHRDLKPHNLFLCGDGRVVVLDFGIAKFLDEGAPSITRSGAVIGTPTYMAPEQINHHGGIDGRTDLYAMAVVLFELVTGKRPFDSEATFEILRQQVEDAAPRASAPGVPSAIEEVIARGLAKDKQDRFAHARDMAAAIRAASTGLEVQAIADVVAAARAVRESSPTQPPTVAPPRAPARDGTAPETKVARKSSPVAETRDERGIRREPVDMDSALPEPSVARGAVAVPRPRGRRTQLVVVALAVAGAASVAIWATRATTTAPSRGRDSTDIPIAVAPADGPTIAEPLDADVVVFETSPAGPDAGPRTTGSADPGRSDVRDRGTTRQDAGAPSTLAVSDGPSSRTGETRRTNEDGDTVVCHGAGIAEECDDEDGEWKTDSHGVRVRCRGRGCFAHFNTVKEPARASATPTPLPDSTRLAGHGQAALRADRWLASAEKIVRGIAPDAALTRMMTTIGPDGVSTSNQATYELRSPSHPNKVLRLIASMTSSELLVIEDDSPGRYLRHPRCALDALWTRLVRERWPKAAKIFVDYSGGAWEVGEPGDRHVVKDYCP